MVLEHYDALDLVSKRFFLRCVIALVDLGARVIDVDVGILEDSGVEVAEQQALRGVLEVLVRLVLTKLVLHVVVRRDEKCGVIAAAHLVNADGDGLGCALCRRPDIGVLEAPAGSHTCARVVEDCPVGARRTGKPKAVAEKLGNLVLRESGADKLAVLVILVEGDGVGGHNRRRAAGLAVELEGAVNERNHAGFEVLARVDGELSAVLVTLSSTFTGGLGRPVLDHGGKGVLTPAQVVAILVGR